MEPVKINSRHFVHADRVGKLKVLEVSHNLNLEGAAKILLDRVSYFSSAGNCHVNVLSTAHGSLRRQYDKAEIPVTIVKEPPLHEEDGKRPEPRGQGRRARCEDEQDDVHREAF